MKYMQNIISSYEAVFMRMIYWSDFAEIYRNFIPQEQQNQHDHMIIDFCFLILSYNDFLHALITHTKLSVFERGH